MNNKSLLLSIAFLLFTTFAFAQGRKDFTEVNLEDLITETQFQLDNSASDDLTLIWWLPTEFWSTVYAADPSIDEETANDITESLDKYTLIIAVDGSLSGLGSFKSKSEKAIRKNLTLFDEDGISYSAVDEDDVNFETMLIMNVIKPVLQNLLGQLGEGMHIFAFEKENGGRVFDAYGTKGQFTYSDIDIELDLPLSSLLQDKTCPEDGEPMNAKWNYCPIHGEKLD